MKKPEMTLERAQEIFSEYCTLLPNSHYFTGKQESDFDKLRKEAKKAWNIICSN